MEYSEAAPQPIPSAGQTFSKLVVSILKKMIHQWEYVKVDISYWKYSYLVKRNLVKAYCKGFGMVDFLFITPLSEELLFFKTNKQTIA